MEGTDLKGLVQEQMGHNTWGGYANSLLNEVCVPWRALHPHTCTEQAPAMLTATTRTSSSGLAMAQATTMPILRFIQPGLHSQAMYVMCSPPFPLSPLSHPACVYSFRPKSVVCTSWWHATFLRAALMTRVAMEPLS